MTEIELTVISILKCVYLERILNMKANRVNIPLIFSLIKATHINIKITQCKDRNSAWAKGNQTIVPMKIRL